mmetsp:Transcript_1427/g.2425  ORF Transcript_1427/g.2425 Transcript_1427/m.2425 type:complete len:89 (-) Transcript_1427:444-710(-)
MYHMCSRSLCDYCFDEKRNPSSSMIFSNSNSNLFASIRLSFSTSSFILAKRNSNLETTSASFFELEFADEFGIIPGCFGFFGWPATST